MLFLRFGSLDSTSVHFDLECRNMNDSRWLLPLKCLLEGVLCARLDRPEEETEQCFRECIARCDNRELKDEKHWLAFATYELGYMLMKKPEVRKGWV